MNKVNHIIIIIMQSDEYYNLNFIIMALLNVMGDYLHIFILFFKFY